MSKKKKTRSVLKNGGILLEELIASFDRKTNPIRCFSSDQILKATDNFSERRLISRENEFRFIWYRGVIEDRPVSIKKWSSQYLSDFPEEVYRDISVSSQMSAHMNSLKFLGCCLEFDYPVLVCEYTQHGPLNRDGGIYSGEVLPWKVRLKIAKEIASAVTYIHTAFPETIIHRFISPDNIFIDRNWTAKLSGFGLCIAIPEGELNIEALVKVDIYSFRIVMLVLLSGRSSVFNGLDEFPTWSLNDHVSEVMEKGGFEEIVDKEIWNASGDDLVSRRSQFGAFVGLALRCIRHKSDDKVSSMIEVAKELKLIEKLS